MPSVEVTARIPGGSPCCVLLHDPLCGDGSQVFEGQFFDFESLGHSDGGQVGTKARVFGRDGASAGDVRGRHLIAKPARDTFDQAVDISTMPVDILAGYIGYERLITVPLGVEDERLLRRLRPA